MRKVIQKKEVFCSSRKESEDFILSLKKSVLPGAIVLLKGPMGSGKTQVASWLAGEAASPTYAFHHSYRSRDGVLIEHFDLDRIKSEDDLESIGFWDFFNNKSSLYIVEWPERVGFDLWPRGHQLVQINIKIQSDNESHQFEARQFIVDFYAA